MSKIIIKYPTKKEIKAARKANVVHELKPFENPDAEEGVWYCNWCTFSEKDGDLVAHEKSNHYAENVIQHYQEYGHILGTQQCMEHEQR